MMLASGETGTKSVTVTAGSWYYYADYGLGSYLTCPYYVKWGSINATAYCVEPSKKGPGNGTYTIQKLADGKTLAKVCYYGTKASDENGFFDEKHPDIPAGKRFLQQLMQMDPVTGHPELMQQERTWQWSFTIIV